MVSVKTYDLPDLDLVNNNPDNSKFYIWQPDKTYIILGQSNKAEESVNIDTVRNDNIPILKRPSGGESVILSRNTLVIAFISTTKEYTKPLEFFKHSNARIMRSLEKWPGVKSLNQQGVSDISVGNIKIAGSAIYRNKTNLFYHCVLNISEDINLLEKYLKHPKREPNYRQGRSHSEFVTNLHQLGYKVSPKEISSSLISSFTNQIE